MSSFFEDKHRFGKWSALVAEHVSRRRTKAESLAWELQNAEGFRNAYDDNLPEHVRTYFCEKIKETETKILQAVWARDTVFLRHLHDAALGKRGKMTITAQAVMALPSLWDETWKEKGHKPTRQELKTRVEEIRKAQGLNQGISDKTWKDTCKALKSIL